MSATTPYRVLLTRWFANRLQTDEGVTHLCQRLSIDELSSQFCHETMLWECIPKEDPRTWCRVRHRLEMIRKVQEFVEVLSGELSGIQYSFRDMIQYSKRWKDR